MNKPNNMLWICLKMIRGYQGQFFNRKVDGFNKDAGDRMVSWVQKWKILRDFGNKREDLGMVWLSDVSHIWSPAPFQVSTTSSSCGGSDLEGINKAFDELDKNFDDSLSEDEMTSCPPAVGWGSRGGGLRLRLVWLQICSHVSFWLVLIVFCPICWYFAEFRWCAPH